VNLSAFLAEERFLTAKMKLTNKNKLTKLKILDTYILGMNLTITARIWHRHLCPAEN
jgi:hypothetical protein